MFQILNFLGFEPSPLSNTRITFTFSAGFACAFGEARFFLAGAAGFAGDGCAGPSPVWKSSSELVYLHAIGQKQLRTQHRDNGVGRPKIDFHTVADPAAAASFPWEEPCSRSCPRTPCPKL